MEAEVRKREGVGWGGRRRGKEMEREWEGREGKRGEVKELEENRTEQNRTEYSKI